MDIAGNNKFDEDNKTRIFSISSKFKELTATDYLNSGARKAFNRLCHAFTQEQIF